MNINDYITELKKLGACSEAIAAARNYTTSQELWADCKRADWMLWLIGKASGEPWCDKRRKLVKTTCRCVRTVYDLMPQKSKDCLELFERWANGEDVPQPVLLAASYATPAAAAAVYAAYAADATRAVYATCAAAAAHATRAVYAVYAAADAAAHATHAVYAVYAAADAAAHASYATRATDDIKAALAAFADMVREDYPDIDEILEGARR